jgi:hypothetical protein
VDRKSATCRERPPLPAIRRLSGDSASSSRQATPVELATILLADLNISVEGSPLISWLGYTLTQLWEIKIPLPDHKAGALNASGHTQSGTSRDHLEPVENTFEGLCSILCEYLNLCIDYSRVEILKKGWAMEAYKRMAVHQAVALFLAAAVRSGQSPNVRKEVDGDRAGIAMWRIP